MAFRRGFLKTVFFVMVIAVLSLGLVACRSGSPTPTPTATGGGQTSEGPRLGGIANFATRTDPPLGWDTMRSSSISVLMVTGSIFGTGNIVRQCPDDGLQVCPGLAHEWESNEDATVWTFHLRDNVYWHDGVQFTAEDVKFWMELAAFGAESQGNTRLPAPWPFAEVIESVEVVDQFTVRVNLTRPTYNFDQLLSFEKQQLQHPKHLMQPQIEAGNVDVSPLDVGLIGTGPFRLESYEQGSVIRVRKFDQYYLTDENGTQLPYLDGIDFFITPDPAGMDTAFRTGRLDATARGSGFQFTPEREAAIIASLGAENVEIIEMAQGTYWDLAFNTLREGPLQDVRVRKAIDLWIDRDELVEITFGGFGFKMAMFDPSTAWANPGLTEGPGWNPATKEQDRQRARDLLAEAGYPNGFEVEMMCRRPWAFTCEPLVGQLQGLGIRVDLQIVDDATREARLLEAAYDMDMDSSTFDLPIEYAPLMGTYNRYPTAAPKHNDPKVDEFFDRLAAATTQDEVVEITREMERYIAVEQVYGAFLYTESAHSAIRSYVKGMQIPVDNYRRNLDFATVWLDR